MKGGLKLNGSNSIPPSSFFGSYVYVKWRVPETKGKTLEELETMLMK